METVTHSGNASDKEQICESCRGLGVVTISDGPLVPLMKEAGTFCHCTAGRQRWEATLRAVRESERPSGRAPNGPARKSRGP
jgi:hypothetical protein